MMAQPAQGPNRIWASTARPRRWTRRGNPRSGRFTGGGRPLVLFANKERVFQKSLAPARRAGEILSRAAPSRPAWRSHAIKERGKVPALRQTTNKNRSPWAAVFLLGQPVGASSATGLRHGASWSCRRCLPALCPSR